MADAAKISRAITKAPPWHASVAADLTLSSLAAGIFLMSALGDLSAAGAFAAIARAGFFAAFVIMLMDLAALIIDLGDPFRFHHMLRVLKLSSPMSTGVWVISLFSTVCFMRASLTLFGGSAAAMLSNALDVIGIAAALYVGAYKGVLLSGTAQPGWKDARWLGAQLSVSSGALGSAGMILIALAVGSTESQRALQASLAAFLALELALASVSAFEMRTATRTIDGDRGGMIRRYPARLGLLLALLIAVLTSSREGIACAALVTLINALALRRNLIMIPHEVS